MKAWKIYVQCQYIYVIIHFYCTNTQHSLRNIFNRFYFVEVMISNKTACNCESYLHTIPCRVFRKWRVRLVFLNPKHDSFLLSIRLALRKGMQLSKNIAIRRIACTSPHSNTCEAFFLSIFPLVFLRQSSEAIKDASCEWTLTPRSHRSHFNFARRLHRFVFSFLALI